MGAGGRQNYAQAAMQTLFGEQLRQLENQAAQPAEVNEELVEQYTPQSTPVGETTEDVTRRFTEGTGAVPTTQSGGLQGILDKIAAEKEALGDLTVTETSERMVPQYEMTTLPPGHGLAGAGRPTHKMVTDLPKGATLRQGAYGQQFYQAPMQTQSATSFNQQNTNPTYRQVGSKRVVDTNVRDAVAGDDIYDKQMNLVNQLQRQYDVRSKYSNPSSTGIQGLIAEPIVNQPQTGYNNINEIMKRYIG
jgi:hypothetical protein